MTGASNTRGSAKGSAAPAGAPRRDLPGSPRSPKRGLEPPGSVSGGSCIAAAGSVLRRLLLRQRGTLGDEERWELVFDRRTHELAVENTCADAPTAAGRLEATWRLSLEEILYLPEGHEARRRLEEALLTVFE